MRKYREELNKIHMSEELKQRIRNAAAKQEHPQRRQKQQLRFIYGCTALCVVIVICFNVYDRNALSQQPENAAQIANSIEKIKQRMKLYRVRCRNRQRKVKPDQHRIV